VNSSEGSPLESNHSADAPVDDPVFKTDLPQMPEGWHYRDRGGRAPWALIGLLVLLGGSVVVCLVLTFLELGERGLW
jgi:hypothetical protein